MRKWLSGEVQEVQESVVLSSASEQGTQYTQCHTIKTSPIITEEQFLRSEALGTYVQPECDRAGVVNVPYQVQSTIFSNSKIYR